MYRAVPSTLQMQAADCGAASLKMLLDYYDSFFTLEELRCLIGVGTDGSTIGDIRQAAEKLGLPLEANEIDLKTLHKSSIPCILWWDHVHFVVYEGNKGATETINDPAVGRRHLSELEFLAAWTGVAITPTDLSGIKKQISSEIVSNKQIIRFMLDKAYVPVLLGLLLNTLSIIPSIILSQLTSYFTDYVLIHNQISLAKGLLWSFFALTGVTALLTSAAYYLTSRAAFVTGIDRSLSLLTLIFKLPGTWHSQRSPQELSSRILLPSQMVSSLTYSLVSTLATILKSIIILVFIFAINITLGCAFFLIFLLVILVTLFINKATISANQALSVENGKQQGTALMTLSNLEKTREAGEENFQFSNWAGYYTNYTNAQQKISLSQSYSNLASFSSTYLCMTMLIILGPILIIKGKISIGDFIGLQFLVGYLSSGISAVPTLLSQYQAATSPITRIRDAFEGFTVAADSTFSSIAALCKSPNILNTDKPTEIFDTDKPAVPALINVNNISFSYRRGSSVFSDLSLNIDTSKVLCLTGKPGSGITTLLKLLSAELIPTSGEILMHSSQTGADTVVEDVRYIDDQPALLDIDFASNITLLKQGYTREDIFAAAKLAGLFDYVKRLPKGIYSSLPSHGTGLSRIVLDRLIISRILIDSTTYTAVDTFIDQLPEADALSFIANLKKRQTGCIVVSHKPDYIRQFDDIIHFG
ncbi:MAG: cysteine peptidase family C39 domain-containing protein [Cyanobacteriota bacterium]|jgi:ABC-type bacteriocin/lantibiotic exporter with double-glycine peptidase domain